MTDVKISTSTEQKPATTPAPATPQQQTQSNPPKTGDKPNEQQK